MGAPNQIYNLSKELKRIEKEIDKLQTDLFKEKLVYRGNPAIVNGVFHNYLGVELKVTPDNRSPYYVEVTYAQLDRLMEGPE